MKQVFVFGAVVLSMVACGGSDGGTNPGTGPLAMGIVSGDHQVVTAGHDSLPQPVVGKLVRKPDGSIAWVRQLPGRALDVLVPRAFAQGTTVTGSPVAGAVVCAVSTDPAHKLIPFVPCTNTASDGTATFFFSPDTTAGVASAEIRGTLNSEPAVFDTARATVTADTITLVGQSGEGNGAVLAVSVADSVNLDSLVVYGRDKYGNEVRPGAAGFPTPQYILLASDPDITTVKQMMSDQSVSASSATSGRYAKGFTSLTGRLYVWYGKATGRYFVTIKP